MVFQRGSFDKLESHINLILSTPTMVGGVTRIWQLRIQQRLIFKYQCQRTFMVQNFSCN